jgi:hypothetical protein
VKIMKMARGFWHLVPSPSVTVTSVREPDAEARRAGPRRYEKVPLSDAVASSILQRYGIEEVFTRPDSLTRRPR